jgi:GntR family transcriptional repressor for pyruvate dehydrogenase complex
MLPAIEDQLKPVSKNSLSEDICRQIMNLISTGVLQPGYRLPAERELCQRFGVGRSSLREAIRGLGIIGVLDVRVGDGTFVALNGEKFIGKVFEWRLATERQNLENLLEVRLALEAATAQYAAIRGTEEQFDQIEEILNKMQACINDKTSFAQLDLEFHLVIAEASNNTLIYDLLSIIRAQVAQALTEVVSLPGGAELAYETHREIYEAIRTRDPEKARAHMKHSIQLGLDRYREASAQQTA